MVVAADGAEVRSFGRTIVGVWNTMIEIAIGRRHTTSREHAALIGGEHLSPLRSGGAVSDDADVDDVAGPWVGRHIGPFGILLLLRNPTGDV